MPTTGQLALLILAIVLFACGGVISLSRVWVDRAGFRLAAKVCLYLGLTCGLGVLVWHSVLRGNWLPLEDNFDTLVWLGMLLTIFVMYVQRRRPLGGLDWFIMPIVILLLAAAAVFGRTSPRAYVASAWSWTLRIAFFGGAVAFAVAAAVGAMYLISDRRLRSKSPTPGPNLGSLERLERLTLTSVSVGFALLTIGMITAFVRLAELGSHSRLGARWFANPEFFLPVGAWIVYAIVLHAPINPNFRGRRAAMLSIAGFVLMIGAVIAAECMPGAKGG